MFGWSKNPIVRRRYVDMWAFPRMHPTNIELLQKLKMADERHFGKNMDVIGTVSEYDAEISDWDQSHLIGIRTDIWRPDVKELKRSLIAIKKRREKELKKQIKRSGRLNAAQSKLLEEQRERDAVMQMSVGEIEKRRMVLKLFKNTTDRLRWIGTIEEITTTEIHNSIGSRRNLLTLAVIQPNTNQVIRIQQNHRTFRIPAVFSFCYFDERNDRMWHVTLKRHWISFGADFTIETEGKTIGLIDGKLLAFGGDSHVNLDSNHPLSESGPFLDLLTLFASSVSYHRAMRKSLHRRVKASCSGHTDKHIIEDEEIRFRQNGRRAA